MPALVLLGALFFVPMLLESNARGSAALLVGIGLVLVLLMLLS